MRLTKKHTEFAFPQVTYLNAQSLYIDRIFTNFIMLTKFRGLLPIDTQRKKITINDIISSILENPKLFENFKSYKEVVEKWISSDFLDVVFRDDPSKTSLVSMVPLHINSYKLSDPKKAKAYGGLEAARQLYTMLNSASPDIIEWLRRFLYVGVDESSDMMNSNTTKDLETDIVLRVLSETTKDYPNTKLQRDYYPPFCIGQARILADDIIRLLAYQQSVPRRVLIEYIKIVMSLHLGLHTIRSFYELEDMLKNSYMCRSECQIEASKGKLFECTRYNNIAIIADLGEDYRTHMADLAKMSVVETFEEINGYLKNYLILKKLDEFADYLLRRSKITTKPNELLGLYSLRDMDRTELDAFFLSLIQDLVELDREEELDDTITRIQGLGLNNFETYIEILLSVRLARLRAKHIEMIDTLLLKNSESGLIRQGRGIANKRRFYIGSNLLEILVQLAVIRIDPNTNKFYTAPILIDDFVDFLKNRYGIYVNSLPQNKSPSMQDLEAFRINVETLKSRLRELGFFTALSDSYRTQIIHPRFRIEV